MSKILITGGSGFLGRGFLRSNRRAGNPHEITIYSRDETKQYEVHRRWPEARCILGDVRDAANLQAVMVGHDIVIHAGAVKYIPEAEHNVAETIAVNVEGSINVARAAVRAGVQTVVGVSTDKACSPLNTYGATKMLMERAFAEANRWSDTRFMTVRYGNVVGSTGSVIPLFMRQLEETGKVKLTNASMTRFWLSIDDAVSLVHYAIQATELPGCTIIPRCMSMKLGTLVYAVAKSMGLEKVDVDIIGLRPGEKMHEALFNEQESPRVEQLQDSDYYALYPATTGVVFSTLNAFSSDRAYPLPLDSMVTMIEDAKDVWL